jgi:acyl transferase domain-containing protein/thioesterase domain-containing protein
MSDSPSNVPANAIAIVGMAGRFPGARTPDELWTLVREGREAIRVLSDAELRAAGVPDELLTRPNYVKAAAVLDDMDGFDASFFGFSPRDAAVMDPQHRHFLECAWEAIEHAGYTPASFSGSIGVFGGCGMQGYFAYNLLNNAALMRSTGLFLVRHTGNDKDFLATRVSYQLDLRGPSVSVQTACSTSLVAIHLACQSLLAGECDMALAGGVTIEIPHGHGYLYEEGEILSPDGHCRSFDAASKGTVFGSGVGIVVLRRLEDAIASGDHIEAIIRGTAVNNDGAGKVGYLAPSVDGQAAVVAEALGVAGIDADTVTYIETHGTGTPVGDPIEITALTEAFRRHTSRTGFCGIGSIKSNIGHLDTAAGIASLFKAIGSLKHRELAPSLHFTSPNPLIDFVNSPFYVNATLKPWTVTTGPRRAGVTSLGVGGTNAHVILEEVGPTPSAPAKGPTLLVLSARSDAALEVAATRLADHLDAHGAINLADAAWTLSAGRHGFDHRRVVYAESAASTARELRTQGSRRIRNGLCRSPKPSLVFLFPGGGAQYPNMGREIYEREPAFREIVDRGLAHVRSAHGVDLGNLLFPAPGAEEASATALQQSTNSILSIFIVEYALGRLLLSWGLVPDAMTGHSLGEYAAACLAGVFSFEDALAIVKARGDAFEQMPVGAMVSVPRSGAELAGLLTGRLGMAAENAPALSVVSGPVDEIVAFEAALAGRDIETRRLHISVAAHSAMLDPFLDAFAARVRRVAMQPPTIPFISNVSGQWADPTEVATPDYWVRHLRQPVRFSTGLTTLLKDPNWVFLEVGPGHTLGSLVRLHDVPQTSIVESMRHPQDTTSDLTMLYLGVGQVWASGLSLDWTAFHDGANRRRVALPTYPFEHQRYWIDRSSSSTGAVTATVGDRDPSRWISRPVWRGTTAPTADHARHTWLVFADEGSSGDKVADRLAANGHTVLRVRAGDAFEARAADEYVVRPDIDNDYVALVSALETAGARPTRIAHLWLADAGPSGQSAAVNHAIARGFTSLFLLARALTLGSLAPPGRLDVVTRHMQRLPDDVGSEPAASVVLGPARVIPRELGFPCRAIDVADTPIETLVAELESGSLDATVALRSSGRFIEVTTEGPYGSTPTVGPRQGGVYLITGGSGGLGRAIAEHVARHYGARVALVGRRVPPDADRFVTLLRALGGDGVFHAADVTDVAAMRRVVEATIAQFGSLSGVYHTAGTIDDGLIAEKDVASCLKVLAPKVWGTLAIAQALRNRAVDFVALFSSTSAYLGLPGQIDYTAANAFLNAFASASEGAPGPLVTSVNWGVWRDAGMAARSAGTDRGALPLATSADARSDAGLIGPGTMGNDWIRFEMVYAPKNRWVLDEHRLASGLSLLPGTAYVELARAAAVRSFGAHDIEIRDLEFVTPMIFPADAARVVAVEIERHGRSRVVRITSASVAQPGEWTEHAHGVAARRRGAAPTPSLAAARAACVGRHAGADSSTTSRQEQYLRFGPRWHTLVSADFDTNQMVARLELPAAFEGDTASVGLHPALLDIATAAGLPLLPGYTDQDGLFVPVSYGRVRVFGTLGPKVFSHVALTSDAPAEQPSFDVTLYDLQGHVVAEVHDFTMRRLDPSSLTVERGGPGAAGGETLASKWISLGIDAYEGTRVLDQLLAARPGPAVIVSSIPLASLRSQIDGMRDAGAGRSSRGHGERDTPTGEIERELALVWEDLLGVTDVGANDDFFELGGHSLIAVRLVNRIEKRFGTKLRLATLFEARTIRQLAGLLGGSSEASTYVSLVAIQPNGRKPTLYVVHAVGGEVLSYSELSRLLGPDQPFYGFRAVGSDGTQPLIDSIEAQAAFYIQEMRHHQPTGPYYLAGYSHGGRVVYEMALQLTAAGERVAFVGVLDTWPTEALPRGVPYIGAWLENFPKWLAADFSQSGWAGNWDRVRRLSLMIRHRVAAWLPGATQRTREIAEDMNLAGLPDHIRLTFETNFKAFLGYVPRPYNGEITLFRAFAQPLVGPHGRDLQWGRFAASVRVIDVPGNHGGLLLHPDVRDVARALRRALAEARAAQ